ncbi:MAG TPA: hypothetical protein VF315_03420 [Steroidobacteraceae bacterium]
MLLLRAMAVLSRRLGRRASRFFLYLIAIYFFLFAPTVRRNSRAYLRRALGRTPDARDRFRHVLSFATTIHDRVYLANERFDLFEVSIDGEEMMQQLYANGQGALLLGAHMGSFEIIHCIGRRRPGLRVSMAMYEENARKINTMLTAISPAAKPEIIGLGHLDAMLRIRERLDQGVFVGVLGDRTLGHEPAQTVSVLNAPARLPVGPMRAAALLQRSVIFMAGLYRGGNRYHVVFEPLADFSTVSAAERPAAVRDAITRYAALIEKYCRSDPYSWFNFFDFWRIGGDSPRTRAR